MLAIIIVFAVIGIIGILGSISYEKKKSTMSNEAVKLKLADSHTATSRPIRYADAINIERDAECFRFAVSEDRKTAYLRNGPKNESVAVPVSSIIGSSLVRDPIPVSNLGRTIVGGVVAGGIGAVVAGNSAPQHRDSVRLVIYLSDPKKPRFEYRLLDGRVAYPRFQYEDMMKFAEDVEATIKALKASEKN